MTFSKKHSPFSGKPFKEWRRGRKGAAWYDASEDGRHSRQDDRKEVRAEKRMARHIEKAHNRREADKLVQEFLASRN